MTTAGTETKPVTSTLEVFRAVENEMNMKGLTEWGLTVSGKFRLKTGDVKNHAD
jgi:hypothetical protein